MDVTREQKCVELLKAAGVYQPAFDMEIHMLAMMEREHQRTLKTWRERGSRPDTDLYDVIVQQRKDILAHRDALGLTPKGMHRLRPKNGFHPKAENSETNTLTLIQGKRRRA